jgi:hypothetical protein
MAQLPGIRRVRPDLDQWRDQPAAGHNEQAQGIVQSVIPGGGFFALASTIPPSWRRWRAKTGAPPFQPKPPSFRARPGPHPQPPGRTLQLLVRKTLLFWGPREIGHNKEDEVNAPVPRAALAPGNFAWAFTLALLGAGLMARRRLHARKTGANPERGWILAVGLALFIAVFFVSYLPFFVAGRYRAPLIPFLLLFGAYLLAAAADWLRRKNGRRS